MTAKKTMTQAERDELQIRISELAPGEGVANSNPYTPRLVDSTAEVFYALIPEKDGWRVQNLTDLDQAIQLYTEDLRPLAETLLKAADDMEEYWAGKYQPA